MNDAEWQAESERQVRSELTGLAADVRTAASYMGTLKRLTIAQDRVMHALATGRDADADAAIAAVNVIRLELGWGTFTPASATPPGYAASQLRAIEVALCEHRTDLRPDVTLDTAQLAAAVVQGERDAARQGWALAGDAERENDRLRAEHAAYLAGRAPAGKVRVTIEGAHIGTGNASAFIVSRDEVARESDGRTYPLEEFMRIWLPETVAYSLEDAEEAVRLDTKPGEEGTA